MKKGKKYLALLLAVAVAAGSLQIPALAETKDEVGVQKEAGEEISAQMQQLKEESEPLTLLDLSLEGVEAAELTEAEFAAKFDVSPTQIAEADREMCADLGTDLPDPEAVSGEAETVSANNAVSGNTVSDETDLLAETQGYATLEDASAYVCSQMLKRKEIFTVKLAKSKDSSQQNIRNILLGAFAYDENGNPQAGDYLYYHMAYMAWQQQDGGNDTIVYRIGMLYRTTLEEEKYVSGRVAQIIAQLDLRSASKTEYEKVRSIYDYVMDAITYDTYHYTNMPSYNYMYTTYGALHDGYAVCQAYATLFYRLCAEVGISARVIAGNPDASTGKPTHGWNIVRLGDVYYNVDATWDDEFPGYYLFFLKSKNGFFEHTRDKQYETAAFEAAFPMAVNNYVLPDQKEINTQGVPAVSGVKAVQTKNNRVSLSWSQVTGADSFYIYRAENGKGYYCIGITTGTSYQNEITPGTTYKYRIYARQNGQTIAGSAEISLTTKTMLPKKGTVCQTKDGYRYKVLSATAKSKKVAFAGVSDKNVKKVIIPKTVKLDGITYQVTEIGANALKGKKKLKTVSVGENVTKIGKNAFSGCSKLVNIVVKSTKLKSAGKNSLHGISAKAVIYVPASKLKKYKGLLQNKGQKKTVKIKK
ncbi:leucine-rich repeat protein [Kineothrix sp. MSJ-39]|uniref:transglutaminase domain-containing protein n=1 Tax=Kineothrix sp. MSJ-39 TaxID=2841533 RepID=UPI001C10AEAF|nr:transglutaminase domain-containing protein [Kineothrix sp. MSJ-39]MBU5428448.1 leucine-rich repeat protein [Kineothrix sp. MSJ-39]